MSRLPLDRDIRKKLALLEGQDITDLDPWRVRERVLHRAQNGKTQTGIKLPWAKTHDKVRLRPGEVSVWGGYNGHQKSTLLCQVAVWASLEVRVGMASFEMELEDTAVLMACLAASTEKPASRWVNDFCTWTKDRIFLYDRLDSIPPAQIMSAVDYMAEDIGCGLIVVDSLMMVRGVVDDMEQEREFIQLLTGLAKHHQTHIALVHHMRKPQHGDESTIPNKYDLRGSGGISDLAHTVFICWHNKAKKNIEEKLADGMPLTEAELDQWQKLKDRPDELLIVGKQRHGRYEGGTGLWQHTSRQFCPTSQRQPAHIDIPRLEESA